MRHKIRALSTFVERLNDTGLNGINRKNTVNLFRKKKPKKRKSGLYENDFIKKNLTSIAGLQCCVNFCYTAK